jgi:DNA-3-methyladenine glycosylase II
VAHTKGPLTRFQKAQRHLARRDETLRKLIRLIGPCTLQHNPDRFAALVRAIIAQQISTKAAAAILGRLQQALSATGMTPKTFLRLTAKQLRQVGLSRGKVLALTDLAEKIQDGSVPLEGLHEFNDEEVIARLLPVRGIGRWTAEMFLIFSLGRMDVLPVGDLGFRVAVQRQYGLAESPDKEWLTELGQPWKPYRSIATWYLWRSLGAVPQSDAS